jgi:hypothetical protein
MVKQRGKGIDLMKTVTKIHEYAAKYLYQTIEMEPKNIAKEIGLTLKQIEKILVIVPTKKASIPTTTSGADNRDPSLMITKTQGNRGGVSIMTPAASTKAEEVNKNAEPIISRTARNAIFRPKN